MPLHRIAAVACVAAALTSNYAHAQMEFYSVPPPATQQANSSFITMEVRPSVVTGVSSLQIPLDSTGFADWRFVNPRSPVAVPLNTSLEFINQTADRTFEVSTKLSLDPSSLDVQRFPSTLPLLVYDVVSASTFLQGRPETWDTASALRAASGDARNQKSPIGSEETLQEYEARLMQSLSSQGLSDRTIAGILDDILKLEQAIREQAALSRKEKEARANLLGLSPSALGAEFTLAKVRLSQAMRDREVADGLVRDLRLGKSGSGGEDYLSKVRKPLIDFLTNERKALRVLRDAEEDKAKKINLTMLIDQFDLAVDALKTQSAEISLVIPLRRSIPSVRLTDCTTGGGVINCSAVVQVYPNGTNTLPYGVLLYQSDPTSPARFDLKFFEEEESPAKSTAYLVAQDRGSSPSAPKSAATISAVAAVGYSLDPFIQDRTQTSRNCPMLCESQPYEGKRRDHFTGTGRVEVTQTFGDVFDGKVSLGFKEGDLGGDSANLAIKLSQYRFNIYSKPGWTFHYGKFAFAAPSSGISINESGEGLRLAFRNFALARIIKREDKGVDEKSNRDYGVWILDASNILIPHSSFFRTISLIGVRGDDRKGPVEQKDQNMVKETVFSAHNYWTVGGQLGFTAPKLFYGTLSAYRSERNAKEKDAACGLFLHVCDGRGNVGLLTITRAFSLDENGKAKRTVTLSGALGSGDDPKTLNKDEGYIGEFPAYSPDQIFLASFAGAISTRDFIDPKPYMDHPEEFRPEDFHNLDIGALGIGKGLANKLYVGLKYVDNSQSLLAFIATGLFHIPESDIRSRSTTVTLNGYRLQRSLEGSTDAGQELDIEFNVETPRSVKVSMKGAYYRTGKAVKRFIQKDAWSVSTGLSISL